MRVIGSLALMLAAACAGNSASTGTAPLVEYICSGRDSDGDVRERVDAKDRDDAIAKFKAKHKDIPVASCTPNPR
jgi:ABC-type glycerol-3-phosphate transport system substrate-binding protein